MQDISNLKKEDIALIEQAKQHAQQSFKPKLTSMAAVLRTKSGKTFTGINVKYKKIWKCSCAERMAIAKAIEAGEMEFDTIVTVKYEDEDDTYSVVNMCGECRQYAIFHLPLNVLCSDGNKIVPASIEEILPYAYS